MPGIVATGPELGRAADAFLNGVTNPNTAKAYAIAVRGLAAEFGIKTPIGVLDTEQGVDELAKWFTERWGGAAPTTFNARMDALRSASAWWQDQQWLDGDPTRRLQRRGAPAPGDQSIDRAELGRFLARPDLPLRERTLWQLLYESAARTEEVLALDVPDLDRPNRRAPVRRKGGAADTIAWQTKTARLLPRLLEGRTEGPLFLTHRRARVELASGDIDPASGRARLSYRRAEELLGEWTADLQSGPWNLHWLRHSALTHAAEDGASTPMLMALSGHTNVNSLGRYSKVSASALARWQAGRDPVARRR
ncbi:tyrosine-type recombinase/integrase [Amycolatopsis sp. NBC_01480]|uniref:tyrosine-type recombinase/integrase n=1 Tax=Amycolatopsis sp. NBC_01480 TaxID=2903562 RepID=UPI002E2DC8B2|nr:site-specific integrase [Amycolatopsis sp. NBC_01480]